jgi:hypothetical protein
MFRLRIEQVEAIACFDPEFVVGPFENADNVIVREGAAILQVVGEYLEPVTIIAIETGHGAGPEKTLVILIEAIDLVVGETADDIEPGERILNGLREAAGKATEEKKA